MPPTGTKAPEVAVDVSTDGAGMAPGVYTGTVTFSSDAALDGYGCAGLGSLVLETKAYPRD